MRAIRLVPGPAQDVAVKGLYLDPRLPAAPGKPFIYGNFLSSLDGRIAVGGGPDARVPERLTSAADLRLLCELQAQADCLITHGGYLRALAAGTLGNILQVGAAADTADLAAWRAQQGLPAQPDIVVASASLQFPVPEFVDQRRQRFIVVTTSQAPAERVSRLENRGCPVIRIGGGPWVEGAALIRALQQFNYRRIYLLAGPLVLHTMLQHGQLDRLYLTIRHQIIGGEDFHTMVRGPLLGDAGALVLRELYLDDAAPDGQLFAVFEPRTVPADVA